MDQASICLTICFQPPFWVGVWERESCGRYEVCRHIFGPEPRDQEVYDLILNQWHRLRFSPPMTVLHRPDCRSNPKRIQRQIQKQLRDTGVGTKAQQALKLQQEQNKLERKAISRQQREEESQRRFDLRQQKRKEKHKGH